MSAALRNALVQAAHLIADALDTDAGDSGPHRVAPPVAVPPNAKKRIKRPRPPALAAPREVNEHTRAMARKELQRLGYPIGSKR